MTERIRDFLRQRRDEGPCLVVDLDIVRDNYAKFARALPDSRVFYAVKANPEPQVLSLLAELGSCFDTASVAEVEKIARAKAATGAEDVRVFCRILCDCAGAEWPLSRKFGCVPELAVEVLEHVHRVGLEAYGVSFHVGSQQGNTEAWDIALASAS